MVSFLYRCCKCKGEHIVLVKKNTEGVTRVRNKGNGDYSTWISNFISSRARISFLFTNISIRMVSGLRLARRREMVSRPPENILSTATADPVTKSVLIINRKRERIR